MPYWGELAKILDGLSMAAPAIICVAGLSLLWRSRKTLKTDAVARIIVTTLLLSFIVSMLCLASAFWVIRDRIPMT